MAYYAGGKRNGRTGRPVSSSGRPSGARSAIKYRQAGTASKSRAKEYPAALPKKKKKKKPAFLRIYNKKAALKRARLSKTAYYAASAVMLTVFITLLINIASGKTPKININHVSEMKVPYNTVSSLKTLSSRFGIAFDELLTVYMVENRFFPERGIDQTENSLERLYIINYTLIKNRYNEKKLAPYLDIFRVLLGEIKFFPVSWDNVNLYFTVEETDTTQRGVRHGYMFGDGFSTSGARHYGTDIFDRENSPGRLSVVSMTNGIVDDMGENKTDGRYVVVLADSGTRYYYKNLHSVSNELLTGARINAGQFLGRMGGSGSSCANGGLYVRLHLGIRIKSELRHELWINPYIFLRLIETS